MLNLAKGGSRPVHSCVVMNSVLFILTLLSIYRFYEDGHLRQSKHWNEDYSGEDISEEDASEEDESDEIVDLHIPKIQNLHVHSTIRHRYARTVVCSRIANLDQFPKEVEFSFAVPESALVSAFQIETDGKVYKAKIGEKKPPKETSQHHYTAHRDTKRVSLSMTLKAESNALFNLTYEELLVRRSGQYRHVVSLDPGQVVTELKVDVRIIEPKGLAMLDVVLISVNSTPSKYTTTDKSNTHAKVYMINKHMASVRYWPTTKQQRMVSKSGINGQFTVAYDVLRQPQLSNELLVNGNYFVQFFAIEQLSPLPKHFIFVLDVSGSMVGEKMHQVKKAMDIIIGDLRREDYFSIITYSTDIRIWLLDSPYLFDSKWRYESRVKESHWGSMIVSANELNKKKARAIIRFVWAEGSSNIYNALKQAVNLSDIRNMNLRSPVNPDLIPESFIFFLTDGAPTEGEKNTSKIIEQITKNNDKGKGTIFTIALGEKADLHFLKKLSCRNSGYTRKIYESSDIALQLTEFYREVSSPLLANVTFTYQQNQVVERLLTENQFPYLFSGSELVVAGLLNGTSSKLATYFTGRSVEGIRRFKMDLIANSTLNLERLWANLRIRQQLEKGEDELHTRLDLEYQFLTPGNSFSIKLPDGEIANLEVLTVVTEQHNSQEDFKIGNELTHRKKENKEHGDIDDDDDDSESEESGVNSNTIPFYTIIITAIILFIM